jgi:DNA-binding FadR family transcriptional regulator
VAISPVSSSSTNPLPTSQQSDDGWQSFMQMANAVKSGDLDAAQQAYTSFSQSPAAQAAAANPASPLAQALSQIAQALQSGDTDGAQQALSSLRPHHRHHHHHGGGGEAPQGAPTPATASSTPDPNAPGATVNLTI